MPFRLTNTIASFQSYIHEVLRPYFVIKIIVYLEDFRVFLRDLFQHKKHVREVPKALLKAGLYVKLRKSLFSVTHIHFSDFIRTDIGVEMEEDCISTILN